MEKRFECRHSFFFDVSMDDHAFELLFAEYGSSSEAFGVRWTALVFIISRVSSVVRMSRRTVIVSSKFEDCCTFTA